MIQLSKIKDKRRDTMTNFSETQIIIREYYKQLYIKKLENADEIDKILERHKFLKMTKKK